MYYTSDLRLSVNALIVLFFLLAFIVVMPDAAAQNALTPSGVEKGQYGVGCAVIGYYNLRLGEGQAYMEGPLGGNGNPLVNITNPVSAQISGLDILYVAAWQNTNVQEYLDAFVVISDFVNSGGILVVEDGMKSAVSLLPGGSGLLYASTTGSENVNVLDGTTTVTDGPGGIIDDSTLDGVDFSFSCHGSLSLNSVPAGAVKILSDGKTANSAVLISYAYGAGRVIYSTIPADAYYPGQPGGTTEPFATNLQTIYTRNLLAYAEEFAPCGSGSIECPSASQFSQTPSLSTNASYSDTVLGYQIAEHFSGITNSIIEIRWWGVDGSSSGPCDRGSNVFEVTFYEDAEGAPGSAVYVEEVVPAKLSTGRVHDYGEDYPEYQYIAVLSAPVNLSSGWVSVLGLDSSGSCGFSWLYAKYGSSLAHQRTLPDGTYAYVGTNHSLCLAGLDATANDICEKAIEVQLDAVYSGSNAGATGTDITSCGDRDNNDVWFVFTPPETSSYYISLYGSDFDTTLAVFQGDCTSLAEMECNDDEFDVASGLQIPLQEYVSYYIRVAGYWGAAGNYALRINQGWGPPMVVYFEASTTTGEAPLEVTFTNYSDSAEGWNWSFDDDTSSEDWSPTHTFEWGGTYDVQLCAWNSHGSYECYNRTIEVTGPPPPEPTANFEAEPMSGNAPLQVTFTNLSVNAEDAFILWEFGDGQWSNDFSPTHTFDWGGMYRVSLLVDNGWNYDYYEMDIEVFGDPLPKPTAYFEALPTSGDAPLEVTFTNLSEGADFWSWSFSDDQYSMEFSPTHTFLWGGTYRVSLQVENEYGTDRYQADITVTGPPAPAPVAFFEMSPTGGTVPLEVTFTNLSEHVNGFWWSFGDGYYSEEWNPVHTYTSPGHYDVSLDTWNRWDSNVYHATISVSPENDGCNTAQPVDLGMVYTGTNSGATGDVASSCVGNDFNDVWFVFTPQETADYMVSLCGSDFNTTLALFDGSCDSLNEVDCNDDYCGTQSALSRTLNAGVSYYIRIAGYDDNQGTYSLAVLRSGAPDNDSCEMATVVQQRVRYAGMNTEATGAITSSCGTGDDFNDIWYVFTPSSPGDYFITLLGSSFNTTLSVFEGGCGALSEIGCNDKYLAHVNKESALTIALDMDVPYYIRVAGNSNDSGVSLLTIEGPPDNDICELAFSAEADVLYAGSNEGASGTDITTCAGEDFNDVWYVFAPTVSDTYHISLFGSDFDTSLAVFEGDCTAMSELACNNNYFAYEHGESALDVFLDAGSIYYIRIAGDDGEEGDYNLYINAVASDPCNPDSVPPVITLLGAATVTVECGDVYVDSGATALDNCDGNLTPNIIVDGATFNTALPGVYEITYNVSDTSANAAVQATRTVMVQDTTMPVITRTGPEVITLELCPGDTVPAIPGATALDSCNGNLTGNIITTGSAVTTTPGTYVFAYNVADAAGNAAVEVSRTVIVTTPTGANIMLDTLTAVVECGNGASFEPPVGLVRDACGAPYDEAAIEGSVDTQATGDYTLTYTYPGAQPILFTVLVQDTVAPEITLLGEPVLTVDCGSQYVDAGAIAGDVCGGDLTSAIVVGGNVVNTAAPGVYVIAYNVTDGSSNHAIEVTRTVTVLDNCSEGEPAEGEGEPAEGEGEPAEGEGEPAEGEGEPAEGEGEPAEGEGEPAEGEGEPAEGERPTLEEIMQILLDMFDEADIDGDGRLHFAEARSIVATLLQEEFDQIDANGDGYLTPEELGEVARCGCCSRSNDVKGAFNRYMGDWLLLGISFLVLAAGVKNSR